MVNWIFIRDAHLSMTSYLFVESWNANLAWDTTTSIIELKYSKSNICWCKGHQCYFLLFYLSFCLRVIRKSLRKNSESFVNLRRSLGQSDRWPLSSVFKGVSGCIEGIRGIMGCFGVFRGCSGMFRGVRLRFRRPYNSVIWFSLECKRSYGFLAVLCFC